MKRSTGEESILLSLLRVLVVLYWCSGLVLSGIQTWRTVILEKGSENEIFDEYWKQLEKPPIQKLGWKTFLETICTLNVLDMINL